MEPIKLPQSLIDDMTKLSKKVTLSRDVMDSIASRQAAEYEATQQRSEEMLRAVKSVRARERHAQEASITMAETLAALFDITLATRDAQAQASRSQALANRWVIGLMVATLIAAILVPLLVR